MSGLWVVGQVIGDYKPVEDGSAAWAFQGVFETEELAVAACIDNTYFIGPAELNKQMSHDLEIWSGAYYPITLKAQGSDA